MSYAQHLLENCLYFSSQSLARTMARLGEEQFKKLDMHPSQAYALVLIHESPGISPSVLAEDLHLAPSTVTRLVEGLERKQWVTIEREGRTASYQLTKDGKKLIPKLKKAWCELYENYSEVLGTKLGDGLSKDISLADAKLREEPN